MMQQDFMPVIFLAEKRKAFMVSQLQLFETKRTVEVQKNEISKLEETLAEVRAALETAKVDVVRLEESNGQLRESNADLVKRLAGESRLLLLSLLLLLLLLLLLSLSLLLLLMLLLMLLLLLLL